MKLIRAWHAFLDDRGQLAEHGGQLLTIGIDPQHRLWMLGDAIGGQEWPIGEDTAGWLSATLAGAVRAVAGSAAGTAAGGWAPGGRADLAGAVLGRAAALAAIRDGHDERVQVRPRNGALLGTLPRLTTADDPPWDIETRALPVLPVYGEKPVAAVLEAERSVSFDCGNGLHAPVCDGCGCECHR